MSSLPLFLVVASRAAEPAVAVGLGSPASSTLSGGESARYTVRLEAGDSALVRVLQRGVDVSVTVTDPAGSPLSVVDSPNGAWGPEWVRFDAVVAGDYPLEVHAIEPEAPEGSFEVRVMAEGPRPTTPEAQLDAALAQYDQPDGPGVAISVQRDGEVLYRKGFGLADLEHDVPVTPGSVFHVASVSKQFTAFAALLLVAEGRLSLDDDVHRYLPELAVAAPITVRNLAQHTSGLRDIDELLRLSGAREGDPVSQAEAVALLCRQVGTNFAPGSTFEYSNSGFILLAEVVQRVSGLPFPQFAEERIFRPLGMTHTRFVDDPHTVVADKAWSYGFRPGGYHRLPVSHGLVGSTGLNTTVEDLARWTRNFESPVVGDRALLDLLEQPGALTDGTPLTYGLGLDRRTYRGEELLFHGGGDAGYRAYVVRIPSRRFSVVLTSNAEELNPLEVAHLAIDAFVLDGVVTPVDKPRKVRRSESYAGVYELFPGQRLTVAGGPEYSLRGAADPEATPMIPLAERGWFSLGDPYHRVSFPAPGTLRYHVYDFTWTGRAVVPQPVDPASVSPGELVGRYRSAELGVDVVVAEVGGQLVVRPPRAADVPLSAFEPDVFTTPEAHLSTVRFVRDGGRVTRCRISGTRARDVVFERVP
ncbi:MAG: serine hydrolase [Myxococcota bacterium]